MIKKQFKYENIGSKKIQDDCYIEFEYKDNFVVIVLDGHGADIVKNSLCNFLIKNNIFQELFYSFFNKNIINKKNIRDFFVNLNKYIYDKKINSGACLSGFIINKVFIYIFNLGDTIAVFYDFINKNKQILEIHNLKNSKEYKRIVENDKLGFVKNNRYKKLNMTRTIGDYDCKVIDEKIILSYPSIIKIDKKKLTNNTYIFLSTDGFLELDTKIDDLFKIEKNILRLKFDKIINYKKNKKLNIDNVLLLLYEIIK